MAERKAQNKYYPPDWDPVHGSINRFVKNKKPIRTKVFIPTSERETGRTIRFEMPFSIWCEGCENHIGIGVRYNAKKTTEGKYHSTTIWKFRMKCHLCPMWFEIHTDPKNGEYKIIGGCRRREESYDPESIGVIVLQDKEETKKLEEDAFYKLEHGMMDVKKAEVQALKVDDLIQFNDKYKDPFTTSQIMRKKFRTEKQKNALIKQGSDDIKTRMNLEFDVLPENKLDEAKAKQILWNETRCDDDLHQRENAKHKKMFKTKQERVEKKLNVGLSKKMSARESLLKTLAAARGGDPFGSVF
jgi:coiled-coil domain-containing protein 130